MMIRATLVTVAACGLLGLGAAAAPAAVAATPGGSTWNADAKAFRAQIGSLYDFVCPAGGTVGVLWGDGTYTDDSSVCTAGVHAGTISVAAGGTVTIQMVAGLSSYTSAARNGITSKPYGPWGGAFQIVSGRQGGGTSGGNVGGSGWSANAVPFRARTGERFVYTCPGGGTVGNVYGSGLYTDDSSVCTAAIHAGLISLAAGGTVTIEMRAGASSYTSSARNGITSRGYGGWPGAFAFPAAAGGTTTAAATPTTATGTVAAAVAASWSSDTRSYRSRVGSTYRFTCPAGGRTSTIWGSGTYTDDSSVCTAAVHAGLISLARGGSVTVQIRAGLSSYVRSTRNGVTSKSYGPWPGAYVFIR